MATESEVAAQILPSLGPSENAQKKLSILSINTWVTGSPSPFKRGTKIFRRLRRQPFLHFGLYDGRDLSNILAPRRGVGRGLGGWGQGLHLGAPHALRTQCVSLHLVSVHALSLSHGLPAN